MKTSQASRDLSAIAELLVWLTKQHINVWGQKHYSANPELGVLFTKAPYMNSNIYANDLPVHCDLKKVKVHVIVSEKKPLINFYISGMNALCK